MTAPEPTHGGPMTDHLALVRQQRDTARARAEKAERDLRDVYATTRRALAGLDIDPDESPEHVAAMDAMGTALDGMVRAGEECAFCRDGHTEYPPCKWAGPGFARPEPIESLVERSSLSTPEARAARESVPEDTAQAVADRVRDAERSGDQVKAAAAALARWNVHGRDRNPRFVIHDTPGDDGYEDIARVVLSSRTAPEQPVDQGLPVALAGAMHRAMGDLDKTALTPSTLVVAVMADYLIARGWPASLRVRDDEGGQE